MLTLIKSEAVVKESRNSKKSQVNKHTKWVIEKMFRDHKKQSNKETDLIEITKPYLLYNYFKEQLCLLKHNRKTYRQNIHRIYAYTWEECTEKKSLK